MLRLEARYYTARRRCTWMNGVSAARASRMELSCRVRTLLVPELYLCCRPCSRSLVFAQPYVYGRVLLSWLACQASILCVRGTAVFPRDSGMAGEYDGNSCLIQHSTCSKYATSFSAVVTAFRKHIYRPMRTRSSTCQRYRAH